MADDQLARDLKRLREEGGYVELPDWAHVRLTGPDRQAFFHNFCTNDIKKLVPGEICEAFVLNSKGKTIGFVHALAGEDELWLVGHGNQAGTLVQHLDMYLIREDVTLEDVTQQFASIFVCGSRASEKLASIGWELPGSNRFSSTESGSIKIAQVEIAGFGYLILCPVDQLEPVQSQLKENGLEPCALNSLDALRIECGTPWFGIDLDDSNLPQELQRDDKAISFDKGCYLGQETVARIDARGRVNKLLVGLEFTEPCPSRGDELMYDGVVVGRVTSVGQYDGKAIGLGYVKRKYKDPGTELDGCIVAKG